MGVSLGREDSRLWGQQAFARWPILLMVRLTTTSVICENVVVITTFSLENALKKVFVA
jgi:hypothetical protein